MKMARFRKKPVEVEAWRFHSFEHRFDPQPFWLIDALNGGTVWYQGGDEPHYTIRTLEGDMRVNIGDYIIRGVKGELYPCKPDIFAATYDAVSADT